MADSTHFHLDTAVELYPAFNSVHSGFGKMYLIATVFTTIWDEDDWQMAFVWKSAFEICHMPCVI